jgi:hypothetical protein
MRRVRDRLFVGHVHHVPPAGPVRVRSFERLGREPFELPIIDVFDVGEESLLRTLVDLCPQRVPAGVIAEVGPHQQVDL